jgi:hypothetical protein
MVWQINILTFELFFIYYLGWNVYNVNIEYVLKVNDHGYVPLVITHRTFHHSWYTTGFVTRVTVRLPLMEQELLILPEHPEFSGVHVVPSLFCSVYCLVDHCLSFLYWPLYCLSFFDSRLLITHLVSTYFFDATITYIHDVHYHAKYQLLLQLRLEAKVCLADNGYPF